MAAQVVEQGPLPFRGTLLGLGRADCFDQDQLLWCSGATAPGALAKPAGGEGALEGPEGAGVAGLGHRLHQPLPAGIDRRPLHQALHRLNGFAFQRRRPLGLRCDHQSGVGPALKAHPHQIPRAHGPAIGIGVGEDTAFRAGLQPHLDPGLGLGMAAGGCCFPQAAAAIGRDPAPQSCRSLTAFLR